MTGKCVVVRCSRTKSGRWRVFGSAWQVRLCQVPAETAWFGLQQEPIRTAGTVSVSSISQLAASCVARVRWIRHCLCLVCPSTDGVVCAGSGTVDVMSGTQRDENNLFMARMDAPSPEQLQQRLVGMLSADGAVADPYAQQHKPPPLQSLTAREGILGPNVVRTGRPRPSRSWQRSAASPSLGGPGRTIRRACSCRVSAATACSVHFCPAHCVAGCAPQSCSDIMAGHAVMSDMSFGISHERTLDAHAGVGYAYRFDYESPIKVWSDG